MSLSVRATEGDLVSLRARALSERREKSTGSDKLRGSDLPIMPGEWRGHVGLQSTLLLPEILNTQPVILVKGVMLRDTFCITDCVLRVGIVHPVWIQSSALHHSLIGL